MFRAPRQVGEFRVALLVLGDELVRVFLQVEELGLAYRTVPVDFAAEYRASDEWRRMNPVGKVPVMTDGDLKMFESGAMVQYLLDRYGEGRLQPPPGTAAHALYLQWSWFAESTFCRPLGEIVNHHRNFDPALPDVVAEMEKRSEDCVNAIDDAVGSDGYIMGDFSAADIMLGYGFVLTENFTSSLNNGYVNANAYWQRLKSRPAAHVLTRDFTRE